MAVRRKRIQELVNQLLRDSHIIKAPVNVEEIARSLHIQVRRTTFDGDDISGFLHRDRERSVIGVNRDHSPTRQRFTIAHEIGHFLLHKAGLDVVHIDSILLRSNRSSEGTDTEEIEANAFAAQLLMPTSLLINDLAEVETVDVEDEQFVRELAKQYGVSPQALLIRLTNLGYIQ